MEQQHGSLKMGSGRFAAMIATSVVIVFFLIYQLVIPACASWRTGSSNRKCARSNR
jgi:succinate dehydrogenase hydrophobic anchor subunit